MVNPGELMVMPRGVEHVPVVEKECEILMLEPNRTFHTGRAETERTVAELERI